MNWFKRRDLAAEFDTYRDVINDSLDMTTQLVLGMRDEVSRLADLADPIGLEALQRGVYAKLQEVQNMVVEGEQRLMDRISERSTNEDIATQRRLIEGLIGEVDILKSQQQHTGALLDRAVIRP